jgi:hypothetical protein
MMKRGGILVTLKRFTVFLMAVVVGIIAPVSTYALSDAQLEFYAQNNIIFYDPEAVNGSDCPGTFTGDTVAEKVLSALIGMGLNDVAAAGVYSNMMAEGFGDGQLIVHEYGVDSRADIGKMYGAATAYGEDGLYVTEADVRDLYNVDIMHGMGPNGWSYGMRVHFLEVLREHGVEEYATAWDDEKGVYIYQGSAYNYDGLVEKLGQEVADKILAAVLDYFYRLYFENEFATAPYNSQGALGYFTVTQDDIDAQGLSKYGITSGMMLPEALNLVATPLEAAELFFTTAEMRSMTTFGSHSNHGVEADNGLDMIQNMRFTPSNAYRSGPIAISGTTIEEKIWSGLTSFLSTEQAAGVMGNMYYESQLNPAMHEQALKDAHQPGFDLGANPDISYGIGLIQWSGGRRVQLYNYIKSENESLLTYLNDYEKYANDYSYNGAKFLELAGKNVTNELLSLELNFLRDELKNNSVYGGIFSTTSVYDAAKYFLEKVEVPENPQIENHMNRVEKANEFYERYKNYKSSSCITSDAGTLIAYVKKYAWPEYHTAPFTERMPDYAEAVARRSSEGLWVGGTVSGVPGIDCGGFVTTVLNDSGFDPNYNYGGDKSKGASNISYGQLPYIRSHQDEWRMVNESVNTPISDESVLSPGDVAFSGCSGSSLASLDCEHTYLYVGAIDGFETHIASASYDSSPGDGDDYERAPMAGYELISGSGIVWFHKIR